MAVIWGANTLDYYSQLGDNVMQEKYKGDMINVANKISEFYNSLSPDLQNNKEILKAMSKVNDIIDRYNLK